MIGVIYLDIPNLNKYIIDYGEDSFKYTAKLQATSTFHSILLSSHL